MIDPATLALLEVHAVNGAQRASDGANNVAEASRLHHLASLSQLSQREALATRSADGYTVARDLASAASS